MAVLLKKDTARRLLGMLEKDVSTQHVQKIRPGIPGRRPLEDGLKYPDPWTLRYSVTAGGFMVYLPPECLIVYTVVEGKEEEEEEEENGNGGNGNGGTEGQQYQPMSGGNGNGDDDDEEPRVRLVRAKVEVGHEEVEDMPYWYETGLDLESGSAYAVYDLETKQLTIEKSKGDNDDAFLVAEIEVDSTTDAVIIRQIAKSTATILAGVGWDDAERVFPWQLEYVEDVEGDPGSGSFQVYLPPECLVVYVAEPGTNDDGDPITAIIRAEAEIDTGKLSAVAERAGWFKVTMAKESGDVFAVYDPEDEIYWIATSKGGLEGVQIASLVVEEDNVIVRQIAHSNITMLADIEVEAGEPTAGLPEGTNTGDVLHWDEDDEKWVVSTVGTGIDEGDLLQWNGSKYIKVAAYDLIQYNTSEHRLEISVNGVMEPIHGGQAVPLVWPQS